MWTRMSMDLSWWRTMPTAFHWSATSSVGPVTPALKNVWVVSTSRTVLIRTSTLPTIRVLTAVLQEHIQMAIPVSSAMRLVWHAPMQCLVRHAYRNLQRRQVVCVNLSAVLSARHVQLRRITAQVATQVFSIKETASMSVQMALFWMKTWGRVRQPRWPISPFWL